MKVFVFGLLITLFAGVNAGVQTKNVSGVYAGIEITPIGQMPVKVML